MSVHQSGDARLWDLQCASGGVPRISDHETLRLLRPAKVRARTAGRSEHTTGGPDYFPQREKREEEVKALPIFNCQIGNRQSNSVAFGNCGRLKCRSR